MNPEIEQAMAAVLDGTNCTWGVLRQPTAVSDDGVPTALWRAYLPQPRLAPASLPTLIWINDAAREVQFVTPIAQVSLRRRRAALELANRLNQGLISAFATAVVVDLNDAAVMVDVRSPVELCGVSDSAPLLGLALTRHLHAVEVALDAVRHLTALARRPRRPRWEREIEALLSPSEP